jgi:hypothetical protein
MLNKIMDKKNLRYFFENMEKDAGFKIPKFLLNRSKDTFKVRARSAGKGLIGSATGIGLASGAFMAAAPAFVPPPIKN